MRESSVARWSFVLGMLVAAAAAQAGPEIVGGTLVEANDDVARSTVALYMIGESGRGSICTGSLINSSTVVTATHCLRGAKRSIVVFARNILRMDRIPETQIRDVTCSGA